jgi:hypothetical protein
MRMPEECKGQPLNPRTEPASPGLAVPALNGDNVSDGYASHEDTNQQEGARGGIQSDTNDGTLASPAHVQVPSDTTLMQRDKASVPLTPAGAAESSPGQISVQVQGGEHPVCLPPTQIVRIMPILASVTFDYIMRCHCCNWYQPTAMHNGGWCMCVRKGDFSAELLAGQTTGRKRGRRAGANASGEVRSQVLHGTQQPCMDNLDHV